MQSPSSEIQKELILAILFLALVVLNVHLIHKADAGGDDMGFIIWSMNASSTVLGALILMITGKQPSAPSAPSPTSPSLNDQEGEPTFPRKEP